MRTRLLIATATVGASLIFVAVSKPSQGKGTESTNSREISLATVPGAAAQIVSALEAGKGSGSVPVVARRTPVRQRVAPAATAEDAEARVTSPLARALEPVVAMSATTSSTLPDLAPAAVPVAPMPRVVPAVHVHDAGFPPEVVSAGPRIIIRGGMGSVHDDCKINLRGINTSAGAAVNRLAPTPGGGYGRIAGMSGGFRGGIR